jgi:aldehyde dehydrogenase (NAD+)
MGPEFGVEDGIASLVGDGRCQCEDKTEELDLLVTMVLFGFRPHKALRFGKISLQPHAVVRIHPDSAAEALHDRKMLETPMLHADALEPVSGLSARAAWVAAFERKVVARERDLVEAVHTDIGKTAWEVITHEIMPLVASMRWHGRHAPRTLAPRKIGGAPWWMLGQTHWSYRMPVGRVLVIATWNYPVQLLGIQLVQSVMAGNRTVVKPSERSPRSQRLLVELAREALVDAGLPADMITSTEATRDAGRAILENEQFDHVVFTGSTAVGKQIAEACARTLTPTTLELSGRDSALVLADADVSMAARSIWHAVTMNAGQTCMAPRRVLVERSAYGAFISAMRPLVASARPVKLADAAMAERCVQLVQDAMLQGGRSLGGVVEVASHGSMRPLCVADCAREAALVAGDHFGPVLAVLAVDGLEDAVAIHRHAGQHLATSVYTGRPDQVLADASFLAALGSNVVTINDTVLPTAHPASSIEGRGASGWGASRGEAGLRALSREVTCSTTSGRLRTPLDEPSASAKGWLRRLAFGGRPIVGSGVGAGINPAAGNHGTGTAGVVAHALTNHSHHTGA